MGSPALEWLRLVKEETGMAVCTEVACAAHVEECLRAGVDMLWIGARTSANPFQVQEIASALEGSEATVLVKNPVNPDIGLWTGALERLERSGIREMGMVLRGFSTEGPGPYRNAPLWHLAIEMRRRFPLLPFLADPSHMAGRRELVPELAIKAMDLGLDGLMIECHCNPSAALSDASQQLSPEEFFSLLGRIRTRDKDSADSDYRSAIDALRSEIDDIDGKILALLAQRMDASRRIGIQKKEHNVAILQSSRWDKVLERIHKQAAEYGLEESFVDRIFNTVHDESVKAQK